MSARKPKTPRRVAEIITEHESCVGSGRGQYRLGHSEVGQLISIIKTMREYVEPHPSWEHEKRYNAAEAADRLTR